MPRAMGSASTHVTTGVGGCALRGGDVLPVGNEAVRQPRSRPRTFRRSARRQPARHRGPQAGRFAERTLRRRLDGSRRVQPDGPAPARSEAIPSPAGHMLTEGVALGAVQVPPDGQPIILFVEHQTTGGYPKPANVISADFRLLGQLRPRDQATFERVTIEQASRLLQQQEQWLYSWCEMAIDLNCDLGELEDAALEARSWSTSPPPTSPAADTPATKDDGADDPSGARRGVHVGAHPGYPDRANFGRIEIAMSEGEIEDEVARQIERLEAVAARLGAAIVHVKPHGALYNAAATARWRGRSGRWCGAGTRGGEQAKLPLFGLAGSTMLEVWRGMGLRVAAEGFADRRYEADGRCARGGFPTP